MEDMTTLKDLKKLITKELRKNVDKGTMSPPEIDAVHKAVETLEAIAKTEKICKELEMMEQNSDLHSGAFYNIRNYPSHGWDWQEDMTSGARGRNMNTGRFTSHEYDEHSMRSMVNRMPRDNYSGHSINDRMVDQLERMMDTAKSEFERQQILDKIKMIRNSPDHMG